MKKVDLQKVDLNLLLLFEVLMQHASVSKAADQLGRTQSAVSHALARLRDQLGDPLLVKVGGRMQPSPYAMELVQEVRPILRSIERVLSPREAFDTATSSRRFRLAVPDLGMSLFPQLMRRLLREAPHIHIQWESPKSSTFMDLAEGLVDLALLPDAIKRPEGVACAPVKALQWACFMRNGHPASTCWDADSWSRWPHIVVGFGDSMRSPVAIAAEKYGLERQVGISVPNFGAVASLIAETDMIATLPIVVLANEIQKFNLQAKPVPFEVPAMPHVVVWGARLNNDPANRWLRASFVDVIQQLLVDSASMA